MSLVGRQIGRYRIVELLGQGGMSVVYRAVDTTLDREVAVKVLHSHLAGRPESRRRLEQEAKAVARLRHPNILEVYDCGGLDTDEAYLVTELIRGRTLRQFLADEALAPPEVSALVVHEVAAALAHAHEAGVIHRDLKPENVMVRDDGVLKLMDFGIAKILDRDEKMTMTGALVGSPAHMAPEIIEGEPIGPEADVFALGTMLYLFATGQLPFTAPNTTATLRKVLEGSYEDPRRIVPTVSDELAEIIATCLQREPSARFPSATQLREALAGLLADVGLSSPQLELASFFADPRGYRRDLTLRLTTALLSKADRSVSEGRTARALAALNQVLAHDAGNAAALALMTRLTQRRHKQRRVQRLLRFSLAAGAFFIVAMSTVQGVRWARRPPDVPLPVILDPTDVVLTNVKWPSLVPRFSEKASLEAPVARAPQQEPRMPTRLSDARFQPAQPKQGSSELLEVKVLVRPWGALAVDSGSASGEELAVHTLRLPEGAHTVRVSCREFCDEAGRTYPIEVGPGMEPVKLTAPLRPALVRFEGYPAGAAVRIGAEQRPVADTSMHPFRIEMPREGAREMRYRVSYEVTLGGATLDRGERWVHPGKATAIAPGANP